MVAGVFLVLQSLVSIHKTEKQRIVAEHLNHIIGGIIFLSVFVDVIKMNFGLDPAVPIVNSDAEYIKTQNIK